MEKKTIRDMGRDTIEQFKARKKIPVTVVLDNVRSLNNIGAIFRTCDAFATEGVALCGVSGTPPRPKYTKRRSEPKTRSTGDTSPLQPRL